MIDNVVLIITGTHHDREAPELLEKCHPLGMFEAMGTLVTASSPSDLYRYVLVDTPLGARRRAAPRRSLRGGTRTRADAPRVWPDTGPYFGDCLSLEDLDEMNIEIIRNTLYKAYLEDFYDFCMKVGGSTAEVMGGILQARALRTPGGGKVGGADCVGSAPRPQRPRPQQPPRPRARGCIC